MAQVARTVTVKAKRVFEGVPRKKMIRRWLNRRGYQSVAYIFSRLSCEEYVSEKDGVVSRDRDFYAELTISDCSRQISLDITADQNTLDKLTRLITALEEVRAYVEGVIEWMGSKHE